MGRVLVAPLDWGLGHTARCVPIISELLKTGADVYFAGNRNQIAFVGKHGLKIKPIELFGYDVSYSAIFPQWMKVGFQSLRLKKIIEKENQWLQNVIEEKKIDIVISDNRFGLHSKKAYCIFITHQVNIPSPLFPKNINSINKNFINQFDECWIPDDKSLLLSGQLSSNTELSVSTRHIGLLSRFKQVKNDSLIYFDALLLLSGVEPQRSILEEKLIEYFRGTDYRIALVRGINEQLTDLPPTIKQFNLLNSDELKEIISQSDAVICRSGYSSIMDLVVSAKKMILIPTPGQPEQEYLAKYLGKKFDIHSVEQTHILKQGIDLRKAKKIEFPYGIKNENLLAEVLSKIHIKSNFQRMRL